MVAAVAVAAEPTRIGPACFCPKISYQIAGPSACRRTCWRRGVPAANRGAGVGPGRGRGSGGVAPVHTGAVPQAGLPHALCCPQAAQGRPRMRGAALWRGMRREQFRRETGPSCLLGDYWNQKGEAALCAPLRNILFLIKKLERETRFELATLTLAT